MNEQRVVSLDELTKDELSQVYARWLAVLVPGVVKDEMDEERREECMKDV